MFYDRSKVSIIIACKNEGEGIKKILQSVKEYSSDIIVVDGHSNDGTEEKAKNSLLVFFDADGSHDERDIPGLVSPIFKKEADLVMGSRRTGGSFDVNVN